MILYGVCAWNFNSSRKWGGRLGEYWGCGSAGGWVLWYCCWAWRLLLECPRDFWRGAAGSTGSGTGAAAASWANFRRCSRTCSDWARTAASSSNLQFGQGSLKLYNSITKSNRWFLIISKIQIENDAILFDICFVPVRFWNYIDVRNLLLELKQLLNLRRCVRVRLVLRHWFRLLLRLRLHSRLHSRLMRSLSGRGSRNRRRNLFRVLRFRLSLQMCLTVVRSPVYSVTFRCIFTSDRFVIYSKMTKLVKQSWR